MITNDPILTLAPSCCENLGIPRHKQNMPDKTVPKSENVFNVKCYVDPIVEANKQAKKVLPNPGTKQLQIKQNQARQMGKMGMAPFIIDTCSIRDSSNFGRLSSGGKVGAMLCFLLFMLVRLLSDGSLRLQQNSREQQPLQNIKIFIRDKFTSKLSWTLTVSSAH